MIDIALAAVPNQTLTIQILERLYNITLHEVNGMMSITISRDEVVIISNVRLTGSSPILPYLYQESGNFVVTTENEELPYYDKFGVTQFLTYLTADELAAFRVA